jgi:hypothetical protein
MPFLAADLADLVTSTQKELGELKWVDLMSDLQEHIAMSKLIKENKVSFDSGTSIQWNILADDNGSARDTGLYDVDNVNVKNGLTVAEAPWRHVDANYAIERREVLMNRSPRRIVDLVKVRRAMAMASLAKHLEARFWQAPTSPTDQRIWGVGTWAVYNATKGFTGDVPSGFSTVAGVNSTTYPRWKNFSAQYAAISQADLILKWREAATKCAFMPTVPGQPIADGGARYGYYANYNVVGGLEDQLRQQNDSLGNDIAPMDGKLVFRRVPVTYVPYLDTAANDPVYGLDWGVLEPVFLEGDYMTESQDKAASQHNTNVTFVDCTLNLRCLNRRKLFVLAKGAITFS